MTFVDTGVIEEIQSNIEYMRLHDDTIEDDSLTCKDSPSGSSFRRIFVFMIEGGDKMEALQATIAYTFHDPTLLSTALNHSSYANEKRGHSEKSNERLEFLGDSVLGFVVANHLYRNFPDFPEGRMTRLRAELVCEQRLYAVAEQIHLGQYIKLGKGEERTGVELGCQFWPMLWKQ